MQKCDKDLWFLKLSSALDACFLFAFYKSEFNGMNMKFTQPVYYIMLFLLSWSHTQTHTQIKQLQLENYLAITFIVLFRKANLENWRALALFLKDFFLLT